MIIFNSFLQIYLISVFGLNPAVAPHVKILPFGFMHFNDLTHESPPVKFIAISTPSPVIDLTIL